MPETATDSVTITLFDGEEVDVPAKLWDEYADSVEKVSGGRPFHYQHALPEGKADAYHQFGLVGIVVDGSFDPEVDEWKRAHNALADWWKQQREQTNPTSKAWLTGSGKRERNEA